MVVAFYFRLHLAYFPRPVVAIFARPEQWIINLSVKSLNENGWLSLLQMEFYLNPSKFAPQ